MYEAIVCKTANVRPHPNADRVNLATILGYQVVVSLTTQDGELGVFFPADGRLSIEHCSYNNLFSHQDLNQDKTQKGYFCDKGRVRAKTFRGEISEGFWQPIRCLDWAGENNLKEGDVFTEINGKLVCEKYVPLNVARVENKNIQQDQSPRKTRPKVEFDLKEHYDTKQLRQSINRVPENAVCYLSDKLHGTCFSAETKIRMADGSTKKIKKIKEGDLVFGFDHSAQKIVCSKVLKTYVYEPAQNWYEVIGKRRGCGFGNSTFKIICTESHEFFTNRGYVPIKDCSLNDLVFLIRPDYNLSYIIKQFLLGKFIGDGSLSIRGKVAKLEFGHKKDHLNYLKYCTQILGELDSSNLEKSYISGYGTEMVRGKTKECRAVYNLLSKYKNKLTESLIDELDIVGIAFAYMDDGSLSHTKFQQDRANFAFCDYSELEVSYIQKVLKKYNLDSVYYKDKKGYSRLRLNFESADKFYFMIRHLVPEILQYKLPVKHRGFFLPFVSNEFQTSKTYLMVDHNFTSIKNLGPKPRAKRYDISTETENFFAHDVLVHNSGRTGHIKVTTTYKTRWQRFLAKLNLLKTNEWRYISGSRRRILQTNKTDTFSKKEFRRVIHDKIENIGLRKGETLYYEIVGFNDKGGRIQGSHPNHDEKIKKLYGSHMFFNYGCHPLNNPFEFYVYRITMTSDDGSVIEYSRPQVVERCNKLGLKVVPLVCDPYIFKDKEELLALCKKHADGPDPIDNSHTREGVVVRIEHEEMFTALKYKGFWFTNSEGNAKDSNDYVDPEDIE